MAIQTKSMPKKQNRLIAAFFRRDVEGKYHMSDGFFGFLLTVPAILVLLTVIAGLIPSRFAARRDPVEALRSE